jgi:hypothetical protein
VPPATPTWRVASNREDATRAVLAGRTLRSVGLALPYTDVAPLVIRTASTSGKR